MRGFVGLTLWLLLMPALAAAQDASATAEVLFDAGRAAAAAGDHATACAKFKESHRIEPGVGSLLNIGDCSEKLGELLEAWQSYSEALKLLDDGDRRVAYAKERYAALDERLPRLTLQWAGDAPPDAEIMKDGVALGPASLGVALPVQPWREIVLLVRAPGHEDRRTRLTMAEAQQQALALTLGPALPVEPEVAPVPPPAAPTVVPPVPSPAPAAAPAPSPDGGVTAGVVLGWTSVALGAAFTAAGIITAIDLANRRADLDDVCGEDDLCRASAKSSIDTYNSRRVVSTVSFVAGGVFAAAGVATLLLLPDSDDGAVVALPLIGPHQLGLGVYGTL